MTQDLTIAPKGRQFEQTPRKKNMDILNAIKTCLSRVPVSLNRAGYRPSRQDAGESLLWHHPSWEWSPLRRRMFVYICRNAARANRTRRVPRFSIPGAAKTATRRSRHRFVCLGHRKKRVLREHGVLFYRVDIIIVSRKGNTSALATRTLEEGSEQTRNMCQLDETGPQYYFKTLVFFRVSCINMDVSVRISLWDCSTSTLWNGILVRVYIIIFFR